MTFNLKTYYHKNLPNTIDKMYNINVIFAFLTSHSERLIPKHLEK